MDGQKVDPGVLLAAERNFLAWIRTGVALMGFGFVLARFGVFLRQFQNLSGTKVHEPSGFSVWFGVALVVIGVLVNVASIGSHIRLVRQLKSDPQLAVGVSKLGIVVATLLAAVGLATAVYLAVISIITISAQ
jgi:putative membrane protein